MKRIHDFTTFIHENFINEAEGEIDGFGGIKILQVGGEGMKNLVPYFIVGADDVSFSKKSGKNRFQVDFTSDEQAADQSGVFSVASKFGNTNPNTIKIVTSVQEAEKYAYQILSELLPVYLDKQIEQITEADIENLAKTVFKIVKDPTLKTMVAKNSLFKAFATGLLNNQSNVKASLGKAANYEGVDPELFKNAVKKASK